MAQQGDCFSPIADIDGISHNRRRGASLISLIPSKSLAMTQNLKPSDFLQALFSTAIVSIILAFAAYSHDVYFPYLFLVMAFFIFFTAPFLIALFFANFVQSSYFYDIIVILNFIFSTALAFFLSMIFLNSAVVLVTILAGAASICVAVIFSVLLNIKRRTL